MCVLFESSMTEGRVIYAPPTCIQLLCELRPVYVYLYMLFNHFANKMSFFVSVSSGGFVADHCMYCL